MKDCPYCAEEIQEDAIKCKHCGEWLNKKSPTDYFSIAKGFIGKKVDEYQEYKSKHIHVPEATRPIELKDTKFYPDHFTFKEMGLTYDQIYGITLRNYAQYINGIPTEKNFTCMLFVKSEQFVNNEKTIDIGVSSELISFNKKKRELAMVCGNWIAQKTLQSRLSIYAEELENKGYFSYTNEIKIYNNGDLFIKGEKKVNLVEAYNNNQIWYGIQHKTFLGSDRGQDPYTFRVNKGEMKTSLFGYGKIVEFDTTYNKDTFDILLKRLFDNGKIL